MGLNADPKDMAFTMNLIEWLMEEDQALVRRLLQRAAAHMRACDDPREAEDWRIFIQVAEESVTLHWLARDGRPD